MKMDGAGNLTEVMDSPGIDAEDGERAQEILEGPRATGSSRTENLFLFLYCFIPLVFHTLPSQLLPFLHTQTLIGLSLSMQLFLVVVRLPTC